MALVHFTQSETKREAAVRRAIISVVPDYFAWSVGDQERYRAAMPDEDRLRIRQVLLKILFEIKTTTSEDVEAALNSFNDEQHFLLNSTMLPLTGIGEDCLFLNECMAENTSLLDFETVYDYDYADHLFQESMRQKDDPAYIAKPYRGILYYRWARLHINGVFHYANLCLLAGYVNSKLEEFGFDKINEMIPHQYVDGKNHGKREGQGFIFAMRVDAGGLEAQLDELTERYYRYLSSRSEAILSDFDAKAPKRVYQVDVSREVEPHIDFIFTDTTALQAVRFRLFVKDCQAIKGDTEELEELIDKECQAAIGFLEQSHQDILTNFDPKVVKFRKKMKVVLTDAAAKDLL
ncbi:MAG: hypothetical protein ABL933_10065 [Methyloglobulus sp.]|nr:hypothetical protein [Methyloglobulus sp.]